MNFSINVKPIDTMGVLDVAPIDFPPLKFVHRRDCAERYDLCTEEEQKLARTLFNEDM